MTDFAIRFDKNGIIQQISARSLLLLGLFDSIEGTSVQKIIQEEDWVVFSQAQELATLTGNKQSFVCCLLNQQALPIWVDCRLYHIEDSDEYILLGLDASHWKESEARLNHKITEDVLTGLPSRKLLNESISLFIDTGMRENKEFAIFIIRLQSYIYVDDSFGYEFGNSLVYSVAERLRTISSHTGMLFNTAMYEFVLIMPVSVNNRLKDVEAIAKKILPMIMRPFEIADQTIRIGSSIGVSIYPEHGITASHLLKHAGFAMRNAKSQGKNNWEIYSQKLDRLESKNLALLESVMHEGLLNGEFSLVYQPIFCIKTGELRGCESLMRWCHPEHGWISPVVFIPLAERSGLINILGAWALRTACRQARAWQVAGKMKFYVSVNVSPSQFRQLDFTGLVNRTLTDSELEPSSLMLEITEGVLMQDPENTISIISGFSESGIKIAIDDFGTGYSSLSYLKKFPLSVLKIDKSFVDHIPQDPKDTAIVLAILELALGLGLVVVAEGVEIKEQLEFLKSKNCDLVQGYYTGKPMTASDFEEKLILCTR